jgi:hypothetical protein
MKLAIKYKRKALPNGKMKEVEQYFIDGRRVGKREYKKAARALKKLVDQVKLEKSCFARKGRGWPLVSDAMGVHPKQIAEAIAHGKKIGAPPTEYTPKGQPIFTSQAHRKEFCERHGFYDRNGGYGDPQARNK